MGLVYRLCKIKNKKVCMSDFTDKEKKIEGSLSFILFTEGLSNIGYVIKFIKLLFKI